MTEAGTEGWRVGGFAFAVGQGAKHIPKITNFVAYDYYRDNMWLALPSWCCCCY